jgi:hypothetical protein
MPTETSSFAMPGIMMLPSSAMRSPLASLNLILRLQADAAVVALRRLKSNPSDPTSMTLTIRQEAIRAACGETLKPSPLSKLAPSEM